MTTASEIRDGMRIDWDVPLTMDDGTVLRADLYRPEEDGRYPVIATYGPYAKGLLFADGYPDAWRMMIEAHPDVAAGSTNQYQAWEVVDPEKWVPEGYVCMRSTLAVPADPRGSSTAFRHVRCRTYTTALNGPRTRHGRTAKSAFAASPTTRPCSGESPRCSHRT